MDYENGVLVPKKVPGWHHPARLLPTWLSLSVLLATLSPSLARLPDFLPVSHGHNNAPIKSTNKWTRRLEMPAINTVALGNHPIQIPSDFPGILKQYTKAAIRTQPRDLLLWSAAYFRCLARGEPPPAKDRLEYPVPQTETGKI